MCLYIESYVHLEYGPATLKVAAHVVLSSEQLPRVLPPSRLIPGRGPTTHASQLERTLLNRTFCHFRIGDLQRNLKSRAAAFQPCTIHPRGLVGVILSVLDMSGAKTLCPSCEIQLKGHCCISWELLA